MANRKKLEDQKIIAQILIRVPAPLRDALNEMAESTGVSTAERVRVCLEKTVNDWRKS